MLQPETPLDAVSQLQYGWFDGIFLVYDVTVQDSLKNLILQVEVHSGSCSLSAVAIWLKLLSLEIIEEEYPNGLVGYSMRRYWFS